MMTGERVAEPSPAVQVEAMCCPICEGATLTFREVPARADMSGDRSQSAMETTTVLVSACRSCGPLGAAMITRA